MLNREVRFYGYLNEEKLVAMGKSTKHISMMEQIVQIKIFGWRNGERVGNAISDILGWDLSELVVNG